VETTTHVRSHEPTFHAEDLDEVPNYRTLSVLAMVSLLFGLVSPVCLAAPVFLAIPLFGTALSFVALQRIAASDGALAGKWAAATGLALCVASASVTLTHAQVTRFLHTRQAKELGNRWVQLLVSGQTEEAFNLTVQSTRPAPPEPPANLPGAEPPEPPYESFLKNSLVQALTAAGSDAVINFAGTTAYDPQPNHQCIVRQQFDVTPGAISPPVPRSDVKTVEAEITCQLSRLPGESELNWLIVGYRSAGDAEFGASN
jgi:hypothetical protein